MKDRKDNGFTLAELLIVVAIIGVLVAISIPIFTNKLEVSREATDLANVRSAYAKVMIAANNEDHHSMNEDGVIYNNGRWYINVNLHQEVVGWQTPDDIIIGGVSPKDTKQWQGEPTPGGICTISYSKTYGAGFAWEYNFAPILTDVTYNGSSILSLFKEAKYPMIESSGGSGKDLTQDIKHMLGMHDTDSFAYKILPRKNESDTYELYVSTERNLNANTGKKNEKSYANITVTGYVYKINPDGSSKLIKKGTTQKIQTYTNTQGQEKMDVYGDQYTNTADSSIAYKWN